MCLLLLLVVYSISMFINNWSRNHSDIQICIYTSLYLHIYRNYRDIYQPTFIYSATGAEEESGEAEGATHFTAG